jgi:hypothetical protein
MPKLTYHAQGDAEEVEAFGVAFTDGKAVEVSDDVAAKLSGNRFFSASKETVKASEPKTATPKKETAKAEVDPNALKAVHIAGGRFVIKKGEEVLKEGLNKADADAFNALTDEEKAEYVA